MAKTKKVVTAIVEGDTPQDPIVCSNDACPNVTTFNVLKLRACSRCKSVQYCCTECQTKDWKARHKNFCAKLAIEHKEFMKNDDGTRPTQPQPGDIVIPVDASVLYDIIDDFNALPRPYKCPFGMYNNHWSFDMRHVPFPPATDVILLYHPASEYYHVEPLPETSHNSEHINPVMIAVALLKCFNDGLQDAKPFAPWTWSAPQKDAALAREISGSLRFVGVRDEMCKVGVARPQDIARADEKWEEILAELKVHPIVERPRPNPLPIEMDANPQLSAPPYRVGAPPKPSADATATKTTKPSSAKKKKKARVPAATTTV